MRAGARRLDEDGLVHSFDHRSNRVVSNKKKASKDRKKPQNKPWWDEHCEEAVRTRKSEYKKFFKNPNRQTLKKLRLASHNAQKVIRKRRRENFRTFINDIEGSSVQDFWENIRKFKNCAFNRQTAVSGTSKTDLIVASIDKLAPSWCSEAPLNCTEIGHSLISLTFHFNWRTPEKKLH